MKLLGMPKASVIDVSDNNENIGLSAKDVKRGMSCFNWLVDICHTLWSWPGFA